MTHHDPCDVQYDSLRQGVVIFYRGRRIVLAGPFNNEEQGREAGRVFLSALREQRLCEISD